MSKLSNKCLISNNQTLSKLHGYFPHNKPSISVFWPKTVFLHNNSHRVLQWDSGWLLNAGPVLGDLYKVLTEVGGDVLGQRSVTKGRTVGGHAGSVVEIQDLLPAKYKTNTNHTLHDHTINVLYMALSIVYWTNVLLYKLNTSLNVNWASTGTGYVNVYILKFATVI